MLLPKMLHIVQNKLQTQKKAANDSKKKAATAKIAAHCPKNCKCKKIAANDSTKKLQLQKKLQMLKLNSCK